MEEGRRSEGLVLENILLHCIKHTTHRTHYSVVIMLTSLVLGVGLNKHTVEKNNWSNTHLL